MSGLSSRTLHTPHPKHTGRTRRLWERFNSKTVCEEDLPDPYERMLVSKWRRCEQLGVDPTLRKAAVVSKEKLERVAKNKAFLLDKAELVLNGVQNLLRGIPGILIFTDEEGTVLHIAGEPSARLTAADTSNIVEGARFAESIAGSNGIGTAIAARAPARVHAAEHYCEAWHRWTCTAFPILDPFGDEVLGVVDFTVVSDYEANAEALTSSLANKIREDLRVQIEIERVRLIEVYAIYAARYPSDTVLVYDRAGRLVRCTPGIDQSSIQGSLAHPIPPLKETLQVFLTGQQTAIGTLLIVSRPRRTVSVIPTTAA